MNSITAERECVNLTYINVGPMFWPYVFQKYGAVTEFAVPEVFW